MDGIAKLDVHLSLLGAWGAETWCPSSLKASMPQACPHLGHQEQEEQRSDRRWSGHGCRATAHVTWSSSCPSLNFSLLFVSGGMAVPVPAWLTDSSFLRQDPHRALHTGRGGAQEACQPTPQTPPNQPALACPAPGHTPGSLLSLRAVSAAEARGGSPCRLGLAQGLAQCCGASLFPRQWTLGVHGGVATAQMMDSTWLRSLD